MPVLFRNGSFLFVIDRIGPTASTDVPVFAFGPVTPTNTADRAPTVDPLSGFACGNTPLGRGHLIALFLGGPDIPQNYAPQYEQWQQGGEWKQMETTIEDLAANALAAGKQLYMAVWITYANTGNNYAAEQSAFVNGSLNAWTDYRIPSRFKVGTFLGDAPGAAAVVADLGTDPKTAAAIAGLPGKAFLTVQGDFDHTAMPDPDYKFWLRNLIRAWAHRAFLKARSDYDSKKDEKEAKLKSGIPATKTIAKGGSKSGKPSAPVTLSKREISRQAEAFAAEVTGFKGNPHLSEAAWKLANTATIAKEIKAHLQTGGNVYGLRAADFTALTDDVTGPGRVSAALT